MTRLATITDIEQVPGSRRARRIWLDGEPFRTTSATVIKKLRLGVGDTVDPEHLATECDAAERSAARERAVGLLARHEFSVHQLARRLADDGYGPATVDETLGRLAASGLVDDARFAEALVRTRTRAGYGLRAIRRDLDRAGVPPDLADAALDAASDVEGAVDATAVACRLARPHDDVHKLAARLVRRGFEFDEALAAARAALRDGMLETAGSDDASS
ncbi:MAG: RecX family transcriptional regulator [Anaerosomatales bacterium]|nr:RecX family transcriptional regulator [Anaerosomatales bacterium]